MKIKTTHRRHIARERDREQEGERVNRKKNNFMTKIDV